MKTTRKQLEALIRAAAFIRATAVQRHRAGSAVISLESLAELMDALEPIAPAFNGLDHATTMRLDVDEGE